MKTLDEVIKACEETVSDVDRGVDIEGCYLGATETRDALHYLKEYQTLQMAFVKAMADLEDNPPLTWDELRQMEGKPVWVEDNMDDPEDLQGYWAIYRRIDKVQTTEYALLSDLLYDKAEYGKTWQAYRKERG